MYAIANRNTGTLRPPSAAIPSGLRMLTEGMFLNESIDELERIDPVRIHSLSNQRLRW